MFSKYATLLAFAASAIAGVIETGRYQIFSVSSQSTARSFKAIAPVFVSFSGSGEIAGTFEFWDIRNSEDGTYTFQNVALGTYAAATADGKDVITDATGTAFNIESVGNDQYVIKLPSEDSLWNVEPPVVPESTRGVIKLRPADGRTTTERWTFIHIDTA